MTKDEIRDLLVRAAEWPEDAQDELLRSMLDIEARYHGVYITSKEERAALKRSEDDMRHARYATHEDVKSVFRNFHRAI